LSSELIDNKLYFKVNGDSKIVQGFGKILCDLFSGSTPEEILGFHFDELGVLKYKDLLTSSRQNGFKQMYIKIRNIAQSHITIS
jgi:sulfur transfer protein SufE